MITTIEFVPNSDYEVSNKKPFVLKYKSHSTISIPKQFITNMYSRGNASLKAYRF